MTRLYSQLDRWPSLPNVDEMATSEEGASISLGGRKICMWLPLFFTARHTVLRTLLTSPHQHAIELTTSLCSSRASLPTCVGQIHTSARTATKAANAWLKDGNSR